MKTILLTGATGGLGQCVAERLAHQGTRLLLPVRDMRRGRRLAAKLTRMSPGTIVEPMLCDLADLRDVRRLAGSLLSARETLHTVISNAAVVTPQRRESADGFELQFAVNHLAPFLLINLLVPLLTRTPGARIVVVASRVHHDARFDFDDLQSRHRYDHRVTYARSKLANVCMALSLAGRLAGDGVAVNALHPGVFATDLLGDLYDVPWWQRFRIRRNFGPPDGGAIAVERLAIGEAVTGMTGKYFDEATIAEPSPIALDDGTRERLWRECEILVQSR